MNTQVVEVLGRNQLAEELLRAGLEVSLLVRDRGIDLIAYADLAAAVRAFAARPIQMKVATNTGLGLDQKYAAFPGLAILLGPLRLIGPEAGGRLPSVFRRVGSTSTGKSASFGLGNPKCAMPPPCLRGVPSATPTGD